MATVWTSLGHGPSPVEGPTSVSKQSDHFVQPEGFTPLNGQISADDNNEQLRFNFDDGDFRARLLFPTREEADFVKDRVLMA